VNSVSYVAEMTCTWHIQCGRSKTQEN